MINNIVLFGTGGFYIENKKKIESLINTNIIGFCDNNVDKWGSKVDGFEVYSPDDLKSINPDFVVIVSSYAFEIYLQLKNIGIEGSKIFRLKEYIGYVQRRNIRKYISAYKKKRFKNIALVTTDLNYDGGSLAAKYAARALILNGFNVTIFAPAGDDEFIQYVVEKGIDVYIYPFLGFEEVAQLNQFDICIVNTFQMYHCIYRLYKSVKVLWWIHESADMYEYELRLWGKPDTDILSKVKIYAVSTRAETIFKKFLPELNIGVLEVGIPQAAVSVDRIHKKITFATIGNICEIKGQDIYVKAIKLLKSNLEDCEFLIIGKNYKDKFLTQLINLIGNDKKIKILNQMSHEKLIDFYKKIDVVVVPSRSETMSLTAIEALMMNKALIVSDTTGIASYLNEKVAYVFKSESIPELAQKMELLISGNAAKDKKSTNKIYQEKFSMEAFAERIDKAIYELEMECK